MRDAQKAAGEAIDRLSQESGTFEADFGANREAKPADEAADAPGQAQDAAALREQAETLRAQADIKDVTGDHENAQALRKQAQALEERAAAIEAQAGDEPEDAFEALAREAEDVIREAACRTGEEDAVVRDADEPVSGRQAFPAAGLQRLDIQLDADDVEIVPADGDQVETVWRAQNVDGEPVVTFEDHTLTIRRKNPDVFKTFFSVFQKAGGRITVRVPRGYGADYAVTTTSGDVRIGGVDADGVKVNTTSGSVRVETDVQRRAGEIAVTTVSGHATISACAETIDVSTVSGGQFLSCDANKVDVNAVSGEVHAEGASDEWSVSAVSSDVTLLCTVAPAKKVALSTMNGDVRLALPGDIRGFVAEMSSALGGEIVNEFGPNRYGACGLPIRMETLRGKLFITRI